MIRATISLKEVPSKCIDFWWYLHHSVCGGVEASLPLLNSFEGWKWVGTAVAVRKPSVIPPTTASVTLCVQKRAYCKVIEELPYPNFWKYQIYELLDAVSVTSHHLTSQLFSLAGQLILKRRGASMSLTKDGEREGDPMQSCRPNEELWPVMQGWLQELWGWSWCLPQSPTDGSTASTSASSSLSSLSQDGEWNYVDFSYGEL